MKPLRWITTTSPRLSDLGLLIVRVWFGVLLAVAHGVGKMTDLSSFTQSVESRGMPLAAVLAPLAAASELVGGILLALGLFTRLAASAVLGTMLVAAFWVHAADPFMKKEFALAYAAAALAMLVAGAGRYSLDELLFGRRRKR
jgi:putative oxidoreductase